jgi:hypothetical protein
MESNYSSYMLKMSDDAAESPAHGSFCDAQAPSAVARFKHLMEASYFNRMRFHSAQPGAVAHFGIASDPKLTKFWLKKTIYDLRGRTACALSATGPPVPRRVSVHTFVL